MLEKAREIYTVGKEIQWSSFTSTSTSLDVVKKSFGKDKSQDIIFEILVSNGKTLLPYSCIPREEEILLSPNAYFLCQRPFIRRMAGGL